MASAHRHLHRVFGNIIVMITLRDLVFSEVPDWWTLAGTTIIVSSGIYLLFQERQAAGSGEPSPAAAEG